MTSGGFVIVVTNNSLNDSKKHSLEPTKEVQIIIRIALEPT